MANNKQDLNQFGSVKPALSSDPRHCAECDAMLMDAMDGTLSAADQATFDLHLLSCVTCSAMLADAQRGAAWLELLKAPRPEPSAALLDRILAQTSGQLTGGTSQDAVRTPHMVSSNTILGRLPLSIGSADSLPGVSQPVSNILPFRSRLAARVNVRSLGHHLLQPRLAMTAAMAFFSVALTMNLTGIRLSELRASDLRPASLKRSISEANAHVVRYYDNLRVVYELESRVHDLQNSSDTDSNAPSSSAPAKVAPGDPGSQPTTSQPSGNQQLQQDQNKKDQKARPRPGTSRREDPVGSLRYVVADSSPQPALFLPDFAAFPPIVTLRSGSHVEDRRLV